MEYSRLGELKISRLGIGTVQFGMNYGIGNVTGQVAYRAVVEMLEHAAEAGVNFLDTSRHYGSSEESIGKALAEVRAGGFVICTKLDMPDDFRELSEDELVNAADESLRRSLESLRVDTIPVYLLHTPEYKFWAGGVIWEFVKHQKARGLIEHIGVSIAIGPDEAFACLEDDSVEMIQIPFNVFDHRWYGVLEQARRKGVTVVSRSSYIQGLLLMQTSGIEAKLPAAAGYVRDFETMLEAYSLDRKVAALKFALDERLVSSTIVGADTPAQLAENIQIHNAPSIPGELATELRERFASVPESIINPFLWNRR